MFSQTTEYALRAICCLAQSRATIVPALTLAQRTGVPLHYLAKVLQQLSAANLIVGRRGLGGGYTLRRPAAQITLTEVVRATETVERIHRCPMGLDPREAGLCALHRTLDEVAALLVRELDRHTIEEIVSQPGADVPLCQKPIVEVTTAQALPVR